MLYLIHLLLPAIVAIVMAILSTEATLNIFWFERIIEQFASTYMMVAFPHLVWGGISAYFEASKGATVGGFIGLHTLLCLIWLLVAQSTESNAGMGWLFYFLGAPIVITFGAFSGRYIESLKAQKQN